MKEVNMGDLLFVWNENDELLFTNQSSRNISKEQVLSGCTYHRDCRKYQERSSKFLIYFCSDEARKSRQFFLNKVNAYQAAFKELEEVIEKAKAHALESFDSLRHDLKTYNGVAIQNFFEFMGIEKLAQGTGQQLEFIEQKIKQEPKRASEVFLTMLKDQLLMKAELNAFEILHERKGLQKSFHDVHKLLYQGFNIFSLDFQSRSVSYGFSDYRGKAYIDYPSVSAAITKIVDNVVKFSLPGSHVNIKFNEDQETVRVDIEMTSLCVKDKERLLVFTKGYSGECAVRSLLAGDGLGMYLAKNFLMLNSGNLHFYPRTDSKIREKYDNQYYEKNLVQVVLPKK